MIWTIELATQEFLVRPRKTDYISFNLKRWRTQRHLGHVSRSLSDVERHSCFIQICFEKVEFEHPIPDQKKKKKEQNQAWCLLCFNCQVALWGLSSIQRRSFTPALDTSFQCSGGFLGKPFEYSSQNVEVLHLPVPLGSSREARLCPIACGQCRFLAALAHSSSATALLLGCSLLPSLAWVFYTQLLATWTISLVKFI